jgi:hypothetical protein
MNESELDALLHSLTKEQLQEMKNKLLESENKKNLKIKVKQGLKGTDVTLNFIGKMVSVFGGKSPELIAPASDIIGIIDKYIK